jgi:hypothetical protein
MSAAVKLTYETRGENLIGTAEIPGAARPFKFKTLVPLIDVRQTVDTWLAGQPAYAADPQIQQRKAAIVERVAQLKARRRLGTAIKVRFGGRVEPYEVAGSNDLAIRLRNVAAHRADIGGVKSAFRKVGRGIKKGGRVVGRGVKAGAKGGVRLARNPVTGALISQLPGGSAAVSLANLTKGKGRSNGSTTALEPMPAVMPPPNTGVNPMLIGGIAAAALGALVLMRK